MSEIEGVRRIAQKTLDEYLNLPLSDYKEASSFEFWKEYSANGGTGRRCLSELARQYLTPPPTSTDIERSFSVGNNLFEDHRGNLNPENAEMLLFLRENLPFINFKY